MAAPRFYFSGPLYSVLCLVAPVLPPPHDFTQVNKARRMPGVHVVHPSWLWCCAERWEHVAEALFPLRPPSREGASERRPQQASVSQHLREPVAEVALLHEKQLEQPVEAPVYDAVTGKRIWRGRERAAGAGPQAATAGTAPTPASSEEWPCSGEQCSVHEAHQTRRDLTLTIAGAVPGKISNVFIIKLSSSLNVGKKSVAAVPSQPAPGKLTAGSTNHEPISRSHL
ncbi:hypothetical protein HPB49_005558 [Dermacentor silvarum]|uniref:Uncharacterized protein n=1 Tax=Dermacentor silvarum TaxID=543639 RepID=A0ACB8CQ34_DERSI|nr:hypothetical protein HPB49_005558 [Dermacentor silvarum]